MVNHRLSRCSTRCGDMWSSVGNSITINSIYLFLNWPKWMSPQGPPRECILLNGEMSKWLHNDWHNYQVIVVSCVNQLRFRQQTSFELRHMTINIDIISKWVYVCLPQAPGPIWIRVIPHVTMATNNASWRAGSFEHTCRLSVTCTPSIHFQAKSDICRTDGLQRDHVSDDSAAAARSRYKKLVEQKL